MRFTSSSERSETTNKMWWILVSVSIVIKISYGQILFPDDNKCPSFCSCDLVISCDCNGKSLMIEEPMVSKKSNISIRNCANLAISKGSLMKTGPLIMVLENINNLTLSPESFKMDASREPKIDLRILNSTTKLPSNTFSITKSNGRVLTGNNKVPKLKLSIENTIISSFESTAFGNFEIESISIINSSVGNIHRFAIQNTITKKLELVNSHFKLTSKDALVLHQSTPTKSLSVMGNTFEGKLSLFLKANISGDACIINNKFPTLIEAPWDLVVGNDVSVSNNTFKNIPKNGLKALVKNRVTLSYNQITRLEGNALQKIIPQADDAAVIITGNIIEHLEAMSLCLNEKFNGNNVFIKNNLFQQTCSCNITTDIADSLGHKNHPIEILYEDKIHQQWFQDGKCLFDGSEFSIHYFLLKHCLENNRLTTVLLISFAVILITMTLCVIVAWRRIKHRNYTQTSEADYQSFTVPAPSSTGQTPWSLVQPDPRVYQETEIHVLFQKAEEIADPEECGDVKDNPEKPDKMPNEENYMQPSNDSEMDHSSTKKPKARQSCPALP